MSPRVALGPVAVSFLVACASSTPATPSAPVDAWIPEIHASFVESSSWIPDSLSISSVIDFDVLTWRRSQQAYCVSEVLLWTELEASGGDTIYALLRAMRWPLGGGDFGDQDPAWAITSSPYAPIDARRFLPSQPTNDVIAEIWPPGLFGVGEGFPVIQGEVHVATWRRRVGEDPPFLEYRLDPGASENCADTNRPQRTLDPSKPAAGG